MNKNKLTLLGIIFVNSVSFSLIIPIIFAFSKQIGLSTWQASLYFAIFGIAQFFAGPLLGKISDNIGRKPLLILSTAGTVIASLIQASTSLIWLLWAARVFDGITGGNNSVAEAMLSDISKPSERLKIYAYSGGAFGLGFFIGPLVSIYLSQISLQFPFFGAALMATIATLAAWLVLDESHPVSSNRSVNLFHEITSIGSNMIRGLTMPHINVVFSYLFIYAVASGMFYFAIQPFILEVLLLPQGVINGFTALFGLSGLLVLPIISIVKQRFDIISLLVFLSIIRIGLFGLLPLNGVSFIILGACLCFVNAFTRPIITTVVTLLASNHEQGFYLGIASSFFGVGFSIGPLIAGIVIEQTQIVSFPFILSAIMTVIVTLVIWKQKNSLIHEVTQ